MNILDRYIIQRFIISFLFILGMILVISVLVDFVEKLDDIIEKKPPTRELLLDYYLNFIPYFASLLTPICVFLAVIFFSSRMAQRTELIPMLSSGISFYRVLRPYLFVAIGISMMHFYFKSYVVPNATAKRIEFEYQYFKKKQNLTRYKDVHKKVAPDTYIYMSWYNRDKKQGNQFSLERTKDGIIRTKIDAELIEWVDSLSHWRMKGVRTRYIQEQSERLAFRRIVDTTFLLTPDDLYIKEMKEESMILPDLREYIRLEEMRGSDILESLWIEWYRRFSDPLAAIILTMIGFAMSSRKSRGGIALQIGLGLVVCFIYIAMLVVAQAFVNDHFQPWKAVFLPNIVFLPIAIFLLVRARK